MVDVSELRDVLSIKILETLGLFNKKYVDVRVQDLAYKEFYSGRVNLNDTESVQFVLKQRGELNLCIFWFSDNSDIIQKPNSWLCIASIIHVDDDNNITCDTSNMTFCHLNNDNKPYFIDLSDYELSDIWRSFELLKLIAPYWIKNEPTNLALDIFAEFSSKVKLEEIQETQDDNT